MSAKPLPTTNSNVVGRVCFECGIRKKKKMFSAGQLKKKGKARCKACTASAEDLAKVVDTDGDGNLSVEEINAADITQVQKDTLLAQLAAAGGALSVSAAADGGGLSGPNLDQVVETIDGDGDGTLTLEEIEAAFAAGKITEARKEAMNAQLDMAMAGGASGLDAGAAQSGQYVAGAHEDFLAYFKMYDSNSNGELSKENLKCALTEGFEIFHRLADAEFEEIWTDMDKDGNGTINYEEMQDALYEVVKVHGMPTLKTMFSEHDTNGDGVLDKGELRSCLVHAFGSAMELEDDEFEDLWKDVDDDKSGTIEYEEYVPMMYDLIVELGAPNRKSRIAGKAADEAAAAAAKAEAEAAAAAEAAAVAKAANDAKAKAAAEKVAAEAAAASAAAAAAAAAAEAAAAKAKQEDEEKAAAAAAASASAAAKEHEAAAKKEQAAAATANAKADAEKVERCARSPARPLAAPAGCRWPSFADSLSVRRTGHQRRCCQRRCCRRGCRRRGCCCRCEG